MSMSSNSLTQVCLLASLVLVSSCKGDDAAMSGSTQDGTDTNSSSNSNSNSNGDGDGTPGDGDGTPGDGDGDGDGDGTPGDGDGTPGDGDGTPGDGDGDGVPGNPADDPNCPDQMLAGDLPITVMGSNIGSEDGLTASCGSPLGEDLAFAWVAPADGVYKITTIGSNFDTVLSVYEGACMNAPELACNDDAPGGGSTSRVNLQLSQGDAVTIYVDGFDAAAAGDYVLEVSELICDMVPDLGSSVPQQQAGALLMDAVGTDIGSCGGDGAEFAFMWTAPADGNYVFDSFGSTYDTVLYVRDGGCGGVEIDCNDDFLDSQSQVSIDLLMGQTVYVVVDAFAEMQMGDYVLNIGMN